MPALSLKPKRPAHKTKLPESFVPDRYTVICGRGKLCSASPGNQHLRDLLKGVLPEYSKAKNKAEKSSIVSAIINIVRESTKACGGAAFVKEEENAHGQKEWWEVDDSFAREKIGCIFRDMLHTQYKSSTKSKHARKKKVAGEKTAPQDVDENSKKERKQSKTRTNRCSPKKNSSTAIKKKSPTAITPVKLTSNGSRGSISPTSVVMEGRRIERGCNTTTSMRTRWDDAACSTMTVKRNDPNDLIQFLRMKNAATSNGASSASFGGRRGGGNLSWNSSSSLWNVVDEENLSSDIFQIPHQNHQYSRGRYFVPSSITQLPNSSTCPSASTVSLLQEASQLLSIDNTTFSTLTSNSCLEDATEMEDDPNDLPYGDLSSIFD